MKMIAHRGASLECQEDTLEALLLGARLGADAVECDPRVTGDGVTVLFHDDDLLRLAGDPRRVNAITCAEMQRALEAKGLTVTTMEQLFREYDRQTPILLDLTGYPDGTVNPHLVFDKEFFAALAARGLPVICGVHTVQEAAAAAEYFPPRQILAFMPEKQLYQQFFAAGAGIIRLWENWLDQITPAAVKAVCPGAEVWIMSCAPATGMNGSEASLARLEALGADGVLLNNIRMAVEYNRRQSV